MRHVLALVVAVACGGGGGPPVTAPAKPSDGADPRGPHQAAIGLQVQALIDAEIVSGVVVGIYNAGAMEIYGFGTGPGGAPPNGRTLFEIGSVTKVYTALLLADAVQRREVALETPVADLLPPGVTAPTRDGKVITLGHLALHTSGLPRIPPGIEARSTAPDPYAGYGESQLYADLVRTQLEATPGTRVLYSNYGYGVLGHVLGVKLAGSYREALTKRVIEPLRLEDTSFTVPAEASARRAQGTNEELVRVPPWSFDAIAGAGALISTARDQLAFIEAQLDAADGGKSPLRRAMALTQEPQLPTTGDNAGLGWQIDSSGRYWHNGGTGGFHSFIGFDVKTRRGVVVLASTSTQVVDQISQRLYRILAGEALPAPILPTPAQLAEYAGTYDFSGQQLQVIAQGKRLYVEGPGEPKIRMVPLGDKQFFIEPLQALVVFERDGDKVSRLVFVIDGQKVAAPRVGP